MLRLRPTDIIRDSRPREVAARDAANINAVGDVHLTNLPAERLSRDLGPKHNGGTVTSSAHTDPSGQPTVPTEYWGCPTSSEIDGGVLGDCVNGTRLAKRLFG